MVCVGAGWLNVSYIVFKQSFVATDYIDSLYILHWCVENIACMCMYATCTCMYMWCSHALKQLANLQPVIMTSS